MCYRCTRTDQLGNSKRQPTGCCILFSFFAARTTQDYHNHTPFKHASRCHQSSNCEADIVKHSERQGRRWRWGGIHTQHRRG